MTTPEKIVASRLLRLASQEFGNHGCNDFDLSVVLPDSRDRDQLVRSVIEWNGDPDMEFSPARYALSGDYRLPNWLLMSYLAAKVFER